MSGKTVNSAILLLVIGNAMAIISDVFITLLLLNYLLIIPAAGAQAIWEGAAWDSSILTSAEYTGLIWAVGIGWIWFSEMPDLWFAVGSAMIMVPLIMVGLGSRQRSHRALRAYPVSG